MTINEFVKTLNLPDSILNNIVTQKNNYIEYDLQTSDILSKVYSAVDKNESLDLDFDNMVIDGTKTHMVYLGDDFDVILESDFDADEYRLIVKIAEE